MILKSKLLPLAVISLLDAAFGHSIFDSTFGNDDYHQTTKASQGDSRSSRSMQNPCMILVSQVVFESGRDATMYECQMSSEDGGQIIPIRGSLPENISTVAVNTLFSEDAEISSHELYIPDGASILFDQRPTTTQKMSLGTKNLLAIIVQANDASIGTTEEELSDIVFGTDGAEVSVKSQFEDCSYNEMNITTAETQGPINNGVVTVNLDQNIKGVSSYSLLSVINEQAQDDWEFDANLYDHILYCLPKGTTYAGSSSWVGYGYIPGVQTVYNGDDSCTSLSLTMHEIGHNLGLSHSNEGGNTYGDTSGYMGKSKKGSSGPKRCFNAAKNW